MLEYPTDISALAEQLCRIEHKLDLVVYFLATHNENFPVLTMKEGIIDPLTHEEVKYYMDIAKRHVVRKSADGTGLIPPSPLLLNNPDPITKTGKDHGRDDDSEV